MPDNSNPQPADPQLAYYRNHLDELSGQVIKADSIISRAKRELKQRKAAFALLSDLQQKVSADLSAEQIFARTLPDIATTLKMDRVIILHRTQGNLFTPPKGHPLPIPEHLQSPPHHLLVTSATPPSSFVTELQAAIQHPFFILVPIQADNKTESLLVAARSREAKPFFPPLDEGDVYTLQSIAGFLGTALSNSALFARVNKMAASFARFVPTEFLTFLNRPSIIDIQLGDQTQSTMTVLFSDIRSFTTLSEQMSPSQTFEFLNAYLAHAAPVIQAHGGFIDKYIGDAIMALFPQNPANALAGAVALQRAAQAFTTELANNPALAPQIPRQVSIGVGLHTGWVMLGTIGFADRLESTVISDAVNLASRMESLTKHYGVGLLITADTLAAASNQPLPLHRLIDRVQVKGKSEPVDLIEVFQADAPPLRQAKSDALSQFNHAFALYQSGHFPHAAGEFAKVLTQSPADTPTKLLRERCNTFAHKPPEHWNGVLTLEHK